jgi:tetratricopeptide (TPR) repeat protein
MPSMAEACLRRGTVLEGLGRTLEAHRAYRRALRLDPDYEPAEDALDALDEY